MDPSTLQSLQSLSKEAQSSLDALQTCKTEPEAARVEAYENVMKLARALEKPRDSILKLSFSPTVFMAVKVASDMNVFSVLARATEPVSVKELAAAKPADEFLVERIMRLVVANGFAEEPAPCQYLPTDLSKEMTERTSIGVVGSLFHEFLPAIQKTPEFLEKTQYKNPEDPLYAPLQYTNNITTDGFTWLCQNPDALSRFNTFMEGQRANRAHWVDWFPVYEQVIKDSKPDRPLLIDIGGGRGHDLVAFKNRFPETAGRLILEELPPVIDDIQNLDSGIETVPYDFFAAPQPVKGARVYYFKYVLHDWSDEKSQILLRHVASAMEKGYSKILIEEYVLSDRNAQSVQGMTDMAVMVFCSGVERTRQRWVNVLDSAGLVVRKFWSKENNDGLGIIEAELKD